MWLLFEVGILFGRLAQRNRPDDDDAPPEP